MPCHSKRGSRKRMKRILRDVKRNSSSIKRLVGGKTTKKGKR